MLVHGFCFFKLVFIGPKEPVNYTHKVSYLKSKHTSQARRLLTIFGMHAWKGMGSIQKCTCLFRKHNKSPNSITVTV